MSFIRYVAPALALAVSVAADCSFTATSTITNPAGVQALATCTSVNGNVVLSTGAANAGMLEIDNVQVITGNLMFENDAATNTFSMPALTAVSGSFELSNLTALTTITLAELTKVGEDLTIINCDQLSMLGFTKGLQSAGTITISNTQLQNLGGLSNLTEVTDVHINGNSQLSDVTLDVGLARDIDVGSNEVMNGGLSVTFKNLTQANSIIIQNATNALFPSLQTVTSTFALDNNYFTNFTLPNITSAGQLIMNSNSDLSNISFPMLQAVNGTDGVFQLANNTKLATIGGFPELTTVTGSVTFEGNIYNGSISQFKHISGALIISSTENCTDFCTQAQTLHTGQVYTAKYNCVIANPQASGTTSTGGAGGTSSSGTSSTTSSGAAFPVTIPTLSLSAGLGAALLQFLLSF